MMKIATVLFTYNRPLHTKRVLEALSDNTSIPTTLFVFHDGIKDDTDIDKWNEVEEIINNIDWCQKVIITSPVNKGLSDSISEGVSYVLSLYDAIIVLEDDCVPHPQFIEYMNGALERYRSNTDVYCIGGSSEPVDVTRDSSVGYFIGRINSWGWATWSDRWKIYKRDYKLLGKIKKNDELNDWYNVWGQDLEATILGNIYGETDSWAVFWALEVIYRKGLCLAPYEGFVANIGFDGTGVHCGSGEIIQRVISFDERREIEFPDRVSVIDSYDSIFSDYHQWINPLIKERYYRNVAFELISNAHSKNSISDYLLKEGVLRVYIWGTGFICDELIKQFENKVFIKAIILSKANVTEYKGISVINAEKASSDIGMVIVIPGYDIKKIIKTLPQNLCDKTVTIDKLLENCKIEKNE